MLERVWRKGNRLTLLVEMQTNTATMEMLFFGILHSNAYIFPFLLCLSLLFFSQLCLTLCDPMAPGALWSRRHDPAPRRHPCRSLGWSPAPHSLGAGLALEVPGEPWFGGLGEVAELYKSAWGLGASVPKALCKSDTPERPCAGLSPVCSSRAG